LTVPSTLEQGDRLTLSVTWATPAQAIAPLASSWELAGPSGEVVSSVTLDLGPWSAGALVLSRYTIDLDPLLRPGPYTLTLSLPDREPWPAATVTVGERPRLFSLPAGVTEFGAVFGEVVELAGYDLWREGPELRLTLYWRSLASIPDDYLVFVHLYDPDTEAIPVQHDSMPRAGTYPTSRWAPGEVVDETITLSLADVPQGDYRLAVGLYWIEGDRYPRLPAVDPSGAPLPADRAVLPPVVTLP
jgi:hypothetical protein